MEEPLLTLYSYVLIQVSFRLETESELIYCESVGGHRLKFINDYSELLELGQRLNDPIIIAVNRQNFFVYQFEFALESTKPK